MKNETFKHNTQVKTTRIVYAGTLPHVIAFKNLTKLDKGIVGTIFESYQIKGESSCVYVLQFYVGNTSLFAYVSDTSFSLASQD